MNELKTALKRLQAAGLSPGDVEVIFNAIAQREVTIAFGERSVAIGGNAKDVVIITGDMHFNVPTEAWEQLLQFQPPDTAYTALVQQFKLQLTRDDYLHNISLDQFPLDFIKTFILQRLHEPHLRERALKLYFSLALPDEGLLWRIQQDYHMSIRRALASLVAEHRLLVSKELMMAMLEDESRTAAKAAVAAASALIAEGHFQSNILRYASGHKSWEVRYKAVKEIIAADDEASVETLCHFRNTTYHRARDRTRLYFERLHDEGRLIGKDCTRAVDLLTYFETDDKSSQTTKKKMRRSLEKIKG
jgi:hypothetical protein